MFYGQFDSRDEALAEAVEQNCDKYEFVFIGKAVSARDILAEHREAIGEAIFENLSEHLWTEIGEASEHFTMTYEQMKDLGELVISHIEAKVGFNCFCATDVVETALPAEVEGGDA